MVVGAPAQHQGEPLVLRRQREGDRHARCGDGDRAHERRGLVAPDGDHGAVHGDHEQQLAEANGAVSGEGADQTDTAEQWLLANYQEGSELRLTRNENFWGDLPYFKDVIIKDTKDAVAQRQLLETGEADVAMQINPDLARGISNDEVVIEEVPSFNFVYIYIWPGTPFAADVHLDDVRVRQAIRYAIDYEGVVDVTVGGSGRKQATATPNGFQGTEGLPLPAEDLEKSKQLLADAGCPDGFWAVLGLISRLVRASMVEVLGQDYIRTARAKGLHERQVLLRHALKNALIPTLTVVGLSVAGLLGGAVLTEQIFSWPGIGGYTVQAAQSLDYPAIQSVAIFAGALMVLSNLATNVACAFVDPRIRLS